VRSSDIAERLSSKFHFTVKRKTAHVFYELRLDGLPPVRTHVSHRHSVQDVGNQLLAAMARELRVPPAFLRGMLDCTVDCDAYYAKLRESRQ